VTKTVGGWTDSVRNFFSNFFSSFTNGRASTSNVIAIAIAIGGFAMCCAFCLLWCVIRELLGDDDEVGVVVKEQLGGVHPNAEKAWHNFVRGQGSFAPPLEQAAGSTGARLGTGRVRWMPLRRRGQPGGGYARAKTAEDGSTTDEEADLTSVRGATGEGEIVISLMARVPEGMPKGGESAFSVVPPSGAHIIIPLPEGVHPGAEVTVDLTPEQAGALEPTDRAALREGRFEVHPGE